jgi:hypothetical protein
MNKTMTSKETRPASITEQQCRPKEVRTKLREMRARPAPLHPGPGKARSGDARFPYRRIPVTLLPTNITSVSSHTVSSVSLENDLRKFVTLGVDPVSIEKPLPRLIRKITMFGVREYRGRWRRT